MTDAILTDDQIAALSPQQRRDLIMRIQQPLHDVLPAPVLARMRRFRLSVMAGGAAALIPWTALLAVTLPQTYTAHNWTLTWVGFDILLIVFMAATAVLGYLRRQIVVLIGFATGVLLICDAWFDLLTAGSRELWVSALSAVVELSVAAILISGALRALRVMLVRLWLLEPGLRLWRVELTP